jgi:DNA-binding NarL/FixJ family response regulator
MSAIFVTSNLMFASRVSGAASALKIPLQVLASASEAAAKTTPATSLVIVDLSQSGLELCKLVAEVRATAPLARIIAFGSHVNEAELAAARAAGCDEVMPNSQFDRTYVQMLRAASVMVSPQSP